MARSVLLGLHSVSNAENNNSNNKNEEDTHDNPSPSCKASLLNERDSELGVGRADRVGASDSKGVASNLLVSTGDGTSPRIKGDASGCLRRDGAGVFNTLDDRSVAEVSLLCNSVELAAVINAIDSHRRAVVLKVGQLATSAQGLVSALVVLVAVLVGVTSLDSTSIAILIGLAGGLESLGV